VELHRLSALELADRLKKREVSAVEVAEAHLARIRALDGQINAFLKVDEDWTLQSARKAQELIDRGEGGALTGVPVVLKDNISTDGVETTCASKILAGYVPPYDATVVANLKAAGATLLGKANLDEFAMGTSGENSASGPTRNPWDLERVPGGSSSGSAASVAACMAPLSLGSDTGGSIRMPASLCGLVGYKPTYGRVSRYGLVAFGSSLDQIGPFARSVADCAALAEAISGHDPLDSTSLAHPPISRDSVKQDDLRGIKIGLPRELFGEAIDPAVREVLEAAINQLTLEGVEFKDISLPSIEYGVTTYYIIAPAEASSNLARFDGIRYGPRAEGTGHIGLVERTRAEGFGREVKSRIMIGTYALSAGYYDAYYIRAQQVRSAMRREFELAYQSVDAILSPTSPIPAFKLGELNADPMALKLLDLCTIPANMGGFPGISLNAGMTAGLPVGVQLLGPVLADERLLGIASGVEKALGGPPAHWPIP
jgi:aspartyl-tRNA(Asn)/glutamyl-tRNA(Gln) amidotransferase subunit A